MSIIEKAVDKLDRRKPVSDRMPESIAGDATGKPDKLVSATEPTPDPSTDRNARVAEYSIQKAESDPVPVSAPPSSPSAGASSKVLELPFAELSKLGILTPITPRSHIAEEFRTIKRPLLRNIDGATAAPVNNTSLVMVTSAIQGDGKTFTAVNLAISIAMEQDKTVLFVDADVAKASAGALLGVPSNSNGLIDVLENKGVTLAQAILSTNIENLKILPAGNVHERSTELLASRSMHELMLEMAGRYSDRVIVFDSPPLLLTTEASVLASFMGQIAFVVSTDNTPAQAVTEALEHIGEDKIIGMVLNRTHTRRNNLFGLGYGYGYGSGYGYGYGYGEKGRTDSRNQSTASGHEA